MVFFSLFLSSNILSTVRFSLNFVDLAVYYGLKNNLVLQYDCEN